MKKNKIRIAFLGGGINSAIGKTHEIATKMDNLFELKTGCFSKNPEINKKTAQSWGVDFCDTADELFELYNHGIYDALIVLTPTNTHFQDIKAALSKGIPVISEKTVVSQYEEALALEKILKHTNGFLLTTYNYTGYPMVREMQHMIQHGVLGKVTFVNIHMPQESFIRLNEDGSIPKPQTWRLKDEKISTISLDLGTHLSNMIEFLLNVDFQEVVAMANSYGHYNVIDNISCLIKLDQNINCNMWYSKSSLGKKNGLLVEVYGTKGSLRWYQMDPEFLEFNDNLGRNILLDRSSRDIKVASLERFNRFKSGHPAGFIEAFANHYRDIHESLTNYLQSRNYLSDFVFGIDSSLKSLALMDAIEVSLNQKSWIKVNEKKRDVK